MELQKSCSEVSFILDNLDLEEKKRIPNSIINFFYENKDSLYQVSIDINQPLSKQNLSEETRAFLYIIYYKYIANESFKKDFIKYMQSDENILTNIEMENQKTNEIIENTNKTQPNSTELVLYKEKLIIKIINKIKKFFKKI